MQNDIQNEGHDEQMPHDPIKNKKKEKKGKPKKLKNFKQWLHQSGDLIEKIVSIVVLLTEIVLLFLHNVDEDVSFYLFTGLNLIFSLFIWYTFVKRGRNMFYTLDEEFGITDDYPRKYSDLEEEETENNDPDGQEHLTASASDVARDKYFQTYKKTEAIEGNLLIRQFSHIRYSWLFTGVLYVIIIINHWLYSNPAHAGNFQYLKPWFNCAIIMVNLLSTYFYLVAYQVMYYSPLLKPYNEYSSKNVDQIPQHLHFKKTSWWFGVMFSILIAYIFSYNYYKPDNHKFANTIVCENDYSGKNNKIEIRLTGGKVTVVGTSKKQTLLCDSEENQTYFIGSMEDSHNSSDTLIFWIDPLHKKKITFVDTVHTHFIVDAQKDQDINGKLVIRASKQNATISFKAGKKIKNVALEIKQVESNSGSAVDFIFQFITGLLSAIILCFFVGRFESMTFQTPPWILIILYFYSVIQGFLVILDVDFIKENDFLISAQDMISKFVFFIALLGKVVLYTYIIGLFSTKRLFYYFIEIKREREIMDKHWNKAWKNITARKIK